MPKQIIGQEASRLKERKFNVNCSLLSFLRKERKHPDIGISVFSLLTINAFYFCNKTMTKSNIGGKSLFDLHIPIIVHREGKLRQELK